MEATDFGFVGEAYEAPMLLQDAQRCINWYCEVSEDKTNGEKMPIALLGCPGLQQVAIASGNSGTIGPPVQFATGDGSTKVFNTGDPQLNLEQVFVQDWQGNQLQYTTSRTNLIQFSQNGASWPPAGATISANQPGAPDGSSTLNNIFQNNGTGLHYASTVANSTTSTGTYSARWIVKAGTSNYAQCVLYDGTSGYSLAIFSFLTNALVSNPYSISTLPQGGWSAITTVARSLSNGFYAIEMTATKGVSTQISTFVFHNNGSTDNFLGNSSNFFSFWGMMVTSGSTLGSYIPTPSSASVSQTDYSVNITVATFAIVPTNGAILTKQTFIPGVGGVSIRGMWTLPGTLGSLVVAGSGVYLLSAASAATSTTAPTFNFNQVGTLNTSVGPVCIRDNGVVFGGQGGFAVIVDGQFGYFYQLSGQTNTFTFTGTTTNGSSNIAVTSIPQGIIGSTGVTITGTGIQGGTTITGANFNLPAVTISQTANASGSATFTVTVPVFGQITDPAFLPASRIAFIEGWLIFSEPNTRTFFTTAATPYTLLFAGSFYALKDSSTDNLVTLYENNRELWLIGERTSEVWYNAGNPNFAFARIPAIGPQIGCAATNSITRLGPDLVWLGRNEQGQNIVVRQVNYDWERISTHAIDHAIASYPVVSDAIGFAYEEEGHSFYMLTFPTADVTWCYDGKTKMWHQRASFNQQTGLYHRHRANAFCDLFDTRLVGDYQSGQIYQMSRNFYSDAGNPLRCQRRAPHVWDKPSRKRLFHSQLQIEFTPGVGLNSGQGFDPKAMLRWYDYVNNTNWSNEHWRTIGKTGEVRNRAIWRVLGTSRDRIYELNFSDPVPRDIIGVTLFFEPEDDAQTPLTRTAA